MIHRIIFGGIAVVMYALAIYVLIGGHPDELTWDKRLKAAGIAVLWGTAFLWGYLRERKLKAQDEANATNARPDPPEQ
ncbi:MAG TPA: hypothetical protein PLQ52_01015 [Lacunisphaera sp.]|jgi:hypothetical protein|nr:hypothetical protein [Lacunisphaera sp.]